MIGATLAILRRELLSYFLSPLSYVIAALFLLVHGYSFYLLCEILSQRQAVTSSVMQYFFGGTFLYWLFLMFVASALTMRLFSEERQQGTLEALLTAPVREESLVLGKYLAALCFYLTLWAPTLAYPLLLHAHASAGATLDPGLIAAGYLGTLLCGLSALGIGLLGSALSRSQVLAAVLSFVTLSLLLLLGMLADVYVKHEGLRQALLYVNLFHHMDELGRGILDSRRVAYHLSLAAAALFLAGRVLKVRPGASPRDRAAFSRAAAEVALCLLLLFGVNVIAARHPARLDLTRTGQFTLSPRLLDLLGALRRDARRADVHVFMYDDGADKNDLYDDVHELLVRARDAAGGQLGVEFIDVDRDRERARLLGEKFRISRDDLREGVIVVQAEGRQKFITRAELAEYQTDPVEGGTQQRLAAFRGEAALAGALLTVLTGKTPEVCFTRGHGEAEHDSMTGGGLSDLSEALRRENYAVKALELAGEKTDVPAGCDVVVAAGPERPFLPAESAALGRYLERGGRLLLLLGPLLDRGLTGFLDSGLTEVLRERGVGLPAGVVVDPEHQLSGSLAWLVEEGYADHPVSAPLVHRRTLWTLSRPLSTLPTVSLQGGGIWSAQPLVQTGEKGFVETDLNALRDGEPRFTRGADTAGPVTVAAASARGGGAREGRLVVLGSAQLATNDGMVLFNRDLVLSSMAYLAEVGQRVVIEPKRPESLRLALSEESARRVMLVTLLGMPLMAVLLGLGVFWIRRG